MSRLESLATKPEEERLVKDESIKDTVLDMANYCIMLAMELERESDERKSNSWTINFTEASTLPLTSIPAVFYGE